MKTWILYIYDPDSNEFFPHWKIEAEEKPGDTWNGRWEESLITPATLLKSRLEDL